MKKNILIIWALLLSLTIWTANADYKFYDTKEAFENDKWDVCIQATDWCNTYWVQDWKITYWTRMFCANTEVQWTCKEYKEDVITTKSLARPTTTSESINTWLKSDPVMCTMDYTPVCWVDQKTYGNRCWAEQWANVEVAYEWECVTKIELWDNDESFYQSIKNKLSESNQKKVDNVVIKFLVMIQDYSNEKKEEINNKLIFKTDKYITKLLSKYPQDNALPEKVNNLYLKYKLLKFELMKLEF